MKTVGALSKRSSRTGLADEKVFGRRSCQSYDVNIAGAQRCLLVARIGVATPKAQFIQPVRVQRVVRPFPGKLEPQREATSIVAKLRRREPTDVLALAMLARIALK